MSKRLPEGRALPLPPWPRYRVVALEYTRQCPLTCAHCITLSSPKARVKLDPIKARRYVDAIAKYSKTLCFTGGEALLHKDEILPLASRGRALGLEVTLVTSGYWAATPGKARVLAAELKAAGFTLVCVSWDRYHEEFLRVDFPRRAAEALLGAGLRVAVRTVKPKGAADKGYKKPFEGLDVRWEHPDIVQLGRADGLAADQFARHRPARMKACGLVHSAVIEPEGRVFACCGPGHFAAASSPLVLGDVSREPLGDILARGLTDPVLEMIGLEGPSGLYRVLREQAPELLPKARRYAGICNLCLELTDNPAVVARLRAILSTSEYRRRMRADLAIRLMKGEAAQPCCAPGAARKPALSPA